MLIFLDTETTGLESSDRICSIGFITENDTEIKTYYDLIKAPKKVRPESSAIHHITNEMLKNKKAFVDTPIITSLEQCNTKENTLVAHNSAFDLKMLEKEGFIWHGAIIDTLKCVRHLIPECEQFSLQYLRYELRLYKHEENVLDIVPQAHNALSDALHVKLLYAYLLEMVSDEKLQELSVTPVLLSKFTFGKYKGRYIEEIAMVDRGYLEWMLGQLDIDEDLQFTLRHWLQ
jgi:DNA polymerase-3 subunit epsilon/exodeoxyribonuclease X